MTKLYVVCASRQPRWVVRLLAALRERGVECEIAHAFAGEAEVWSLVIGGERGEIPAFEEAAGGADSVDVRLVAGTLGDPSRQPRNLRFGRFPYASRHRRTLERIVDQCVAWIEQEAKAHAGPAVVLSLRPSRNLKLTIFDRVRLLLSEMLRFAHHALRYAFEEARWDVAVTRSSIEGFLANPRSTWLHWIARDNREFLADPFIVRTDDRLRLLCETHRGPQPSIVAIDLEQPFGERTPVFADDGPMSYPYVFDVGSETWLLPEQHRRGILGAYHLNGVATMTAQWDLGEIAAVDSTIVQHDGRWWLFCTNQRSGPNYALHVFWADSPRGPWQPHARNPVKVDVTGARPAGNFFTLGGRLHRPAQDCTKRYGSSVSIQRIDVLTPERFEETCVARIEPPVIARKGAVGVHTLSHGHGWIAIDAQFVRWSLAKPLRLLRERIA